LLLKGTPFEVLREYVDDLVGEKARELKKEDLWDRVE